MRILRGKNFCDISPTTYAISLQKEILKRKLQDTLGKEKFAFERSTQKLGTVVFAYDSGLIKRGPGIDPVLQENKAINIQLACNKLNGLVVHPGEVFSFWHIVGNTTKKNGYKDGRVIVGGKLMPGIGGGLCNLANTISLLVYHSPLDVTEIHFHSDALAPDGEIRVPLSTGTSVSYNNIDFRFKNNTDRDVQLLVWCENERLYAQLRSTSEFPFHYEITEEGHRFICEGGKYYRISKIYRDTYDNTSKKMLSHDLIRDNRSEVMYDPKLIKQTVS